MILVKNKLPNDKLQEILDNFLLLNFLLFIVHKENIFLQALLTEQRLPVCWFSVCGVCVVWDNFLASDW